MRHAKRFLCLLSALLLMMILCACQAPGETAVSLAPSQGVEETMVPTQTPEPTQAPSQQPQESEQVQQADEPKATETPEKKSAPTQKPASNSTPKSTPQPTPKPTPQPTPKPKTCYLSIECKTILNRMEDLTEGKESLIPGDGVILSQKAFTFQDGETVFDVLSRAAKQYNIHLEYEFTPGFGSYYIEGIHNLYEFDCGAGSGWMYFVNGVKPNYGCSQYTLKDGDVIQWRYTCDLGYDF